MEHGFSRCLSGHDVLNCMCFTGAFATKDCQRFLLSRGNGQDGPPKRERVLIACFLSCPLFKSFALSLFLRKRARTAACGRLTCRRTVSLVWRDFKRGVRRGNIVVLFTKLGGNTFYCFSAMMKMLRKHVNARQNTSGVFQGGTSGF